MVDFPHEEDYGLDPQEAEAIRKEVESWPEREVNGKRSRWSKELVGSFYMQPPASRICPTQLSRDELSRMVHSGKLQRLPLFLDHRKELGTIGTITDAFQIGDGSCFARMAIDCSTAKGRAIWHHVKKHTVLGVSLSHYAHTGEPDEISLCIQPGREDCVLVNAHYPLQMSSSLTASGNSMVETSVSDSGLTMQEVEQLMTPDMRNMVTSLLQNHKAEAKTEATDPPAATPPPPPSAAAAPPPPPPAQPQAAIPAQQLSKLSELAEKLGQKLKSKKREMDMDEDEPAEVDAETLKQQKLIELQRREIAKLRAQQAKLRDQAAEAEARKSLNEFLQQIPKGTRAKSELERKAQVLKHKLTRSNPLIAMSASAQLQEEEEEEGQPRVEEAEEEEEEKEEPPGTYCSQHGRKQCAKGSCVAERLNMAKKKKREQINQKKPKASEEMDMDEEAETRAREEDEEEPPRKPKRTSTDMKKQHESIERRGGDDKLMQSIYETMKEFVRLAEHTPYNPETASTTDPNLIKMSADRHTQFRRAIFSAVAPAASNPMVYRTGDRIFYAGTGEPQ